MGQAALRAVGAARPARRSSRGFFIVLPVALCAVLSCSKASVTPPPVAAAPAVEVTPEPQSSPEEARRSEARRGLDLLARKQWDDAVATLTGAADDYPEVAPFLRLRVAEAEAARGNAQGAAATLAEIAALPETTAATVARLRLPPVLAQLGDRTSTDAAWQQAMQVTIDELTEADFVSMATALAKAGRTDLATQTRLRLLTTYTNGRYTEQTFGFLRDELAKLSGNERLELAAKLARANRYDQALALMPADSTEARALRLRALFNSRHYTEVLTETENVKLGDPALMLLRARAAWRDDRPQVFLAGLAELEKSFPDSREAVEAKIQRAKYYTTDDVDYGRSIENLSSAIDAGAVGAEGENVWNLGWTYVLWGRDDEALKVFDRYIRAYPDGDWKTNSLFWSAKILDKQGRTAERDAKARQIVAEYPFSYYAYRAKELWPSAGLVERRPLPAAEDLAENPRPGTAAPQVFPSIDISSLNEPRLRTVSELLAIGLDRTAAREMKVVAAKYADNPGVQFLLADVYLRGGEPLKANGVLQRNFRQFVRHGGENIPRRFWEILFPLPWWDTIRAEAERRGHDPYLIASIIRQESAFEPSTVSNAGAVGLMQIMPEEAARIGADGGLGEVTREDLFDPATNIAVGAAEFSQKLERMDDNRTLAIAAYNAGEQPVREWVTRTGLDDLDRFIEAIPYAETRLYVKTVTRNQHEYRRIYQ
jgi:soluble lytic murein transglycosylase